MPQPNGHVISFAWALGLDSMFLRREPKNKGTLISVSAHIDTGQMYQVTFKHGDKFTRNWYYQSELDSDIS